MADIEKRVRIIDVETTGLEEGDQLVEIGSVDWTGSEFELGNAMNTFVKPTIQIPATASAIHHIIDSMVVDAPGADEAIAMFAGAPIYAAHNANFDRRFLGYPGPWICTYKVAYKVFTDAPGHGNQVLRYWLDLAPLPEWIGSLAHRALFDAWTTARLFERLTFEMTVADMVRISREPLTLRSLKFGEHKGKPIADVPKSYLEWILRNDFDEDTVHTARTYLLS
jgi:exodeoxyribonuclease X